MNKIIKRKGIRERNKLNYRTKNSWENIIVTLQKINYLKPNGHYMYQQV
jgi:hypothetical protein